MKNFVIKININIHRYQYAHIWACAPEEGDSYIFNGRFPNEPPLKQNILIKWYRKMFKLGKVSLSTV